MINFFKTSALLTAFIMCFSLCSCSSSKNESSEAEDSLKNIEKIAQDNKNAPDFNLYSDPNSFDETISGNISYNNISFGLVDTYGFNKAFDHIVCDENGSGLISFKIDYGLNNDDTQLKFDANIKSYIDNQTSKTTLNIDDVEITKILWENNDRNWKTYIFILYNEIYTINFSAETSHCNDCSIYSEADDMINSLQFNKQEVSTELLTEASTEKPTEKDTEPPTEEETEPPTEKETDAPTEESTEKTIPKEYTNALTKAKIYSDTMYMSKAAIHDQLTSEYGEGFSEEAADYAVENLVADYKENALHKAHTYQDTMAMSINAIYDQLISEYGEQFTEEEAQYAIDNLE